MKKIAVVLLIVVALLIALQVVSGSKRAHAKTIDYKKYVLTGREYGAFKYVSDLDNDNLFPIPVGHSVYDDQTVVCLFDDSIDFGNRLSYDALIALPILERINIVGQITRICSFLHTHKLHIPVVGFDDFAFDTKRVVTLASFGKVKSQVLSGFDIPERESSEDLFDDRFDLTEDCKRLTVDVVGQQHHAPAAKIAIDENISESEQMFIRMTRLCVQVLLEERVFEDFSDLGIMNVRLNNDHLKFTTGRLARLLSNHDFYLLTKLALGLFRVTFRVKTPSSVDQLHADYAQITQLTSSNTLHIHPSFFIPHAGVSLIEEIKRDSDQVIEWLVLSKEMKCDRIRELLINGQDVEVIELRNRIAFRYPRNHLKRYRSCGWNELKDLVSDLFSCGLTIANEFVDDELMIVKEGNQVQLASLDGLVQTDPVHVSSIYNDLETFTLNNRDYDSTPGVNNREYLLLNRVMKGKFKPMWRESLNLLHDYDHVSKDPMSFDGLSILQLKRKNHSKTDKLIYGKIEGRWCPEDKEFMKCRHVFGLGDCLLLMPGDDSNEVWIEKIDDLNKITGAEQFFIHEQLAALIDVLSSYGKYFSERAELDFRTMNGVNLFKVNREHVVCLSMPFVVTMHGKNFDFDQLKSRSMRNIEFLLPN